MTQHRNVTNVVQTNVGHSLCCNCLSYSLSHRTPMGEDSSQRSPMQRCAQPLNNNLTIGYHSIRLSMKFIVISLSLMTFIDRSVLSAISVNNSLDKYCIHLVQTCLQNYWICSKSLRKITDTLYYDERPHSLFQALGPDLGSH